MMLANSLHEVAPFSLEMLGQKFLNTMFNRNLYILSAIDTYAPYQHNKYNLLTLKP